MFKIILRPIDWIKNHWKLLLILAVVAGALGFWWYRQHTKNNIKLVFEKPEIGTLTKTLQVSGVIDAKEKVSMRFAAGGKVVSLKAKEGDFVKKGQTIAVIDRRELEKKLQQDLNTYMQERWDWDQLLDDTKDRTLPKSEIRSKDKSQWDLTDTVLDVEIRDVAIKNTVLSAPFAGILTVAPTPVSGVNLLATDVFELINPQTLVFKAKVDEADIGLVKLGQTAALTLDAYPEEKIPVTVTSIALKASQSTTGTIFLVELPITNSSDLDKFRLGMNGDVTIVLAKKNQVLSIPYNATRERENHTYVDVRTGEKTFAEREIKLGLTTDERVEVTSGLKPNEEVLLP